MTPDAKRAALRRGNLAYGRHFQVIPRSQWSKRQRGPDSLLAQVWRNRDYLVQLFTEGDGRLTVCRTQLEPDGGRWLDGISWDALMEVKAAVGFGDRWAVECYPPDAEVVDVANMRHLWLLTEQPSYGWSSTRGTT